jgi:hypothetical protein
MNAAGIEAVACRRLSPAKHAKKERPTEAPFLVMLSRLRRGDYKRKARSTALIIIIFILLGSFQVLLHIGNFRLYLVFDKFPLLDLNSIGII